MNETRSTERAQSLASAVVGIPIRGLQQTNILGALCILILCGILIAGLWPFHSPVNDVTWLGDENGLRFGRHGTILSSGPLSISSSEDQTSAALEMWIQPIAENERTLLAFSTPEQPLQFLIRRYRSGIVLRSEVLDPVQNGAVEIYIADVFHDRQAVLLTVTSGSGRTAVYANGALLNTSSYFHFSARDFDGRVVFGTSPLGSDAWPGLLRGLAFYTQDLTAAQVARHFETWSSKGRPDLSQNERVLALYLFDEHRGSIVHNRSGPGVDLYIPERYAIVHEKFLEPLWEEFRPASWSYWKDVGINIGGFIPLGFFFCAYLTMTTQTSRPAIATIILGAAVSLTIEVLQSFLPTRDSGMTDLITNTLGTSLGVILYRWNADLLVKVLYRVRLVAA
jgi:hypothetical protein